MGIAASFGWDVPWGTDEAWWTFFVTAGDPLVVQDPNKLTKLAEIIWFTQQRNPKTTKWPVIPAWNTRAFQIFDNGNFRGKPLLYGLHRPEIAHTVKNIGRSVDPPGDRVRCIGGQGHITASDWYASLATSAVDGGPSSWALDLGMAKKRLEERWADPNALYWWNVRE